MCTFNEVFTADEKKILSSYVTNTNRSIFALTNLPEVIKGALFSRYSRSTLGLRTLLLRDFIQENESRFAEIQGGGEHPDFAKNTELAIESAQKFYDRILDGYGDDSIGELGGAHLALENISILATKTLEDARIGGSPLEKSTRYVSFAEKITGTSSANEEFGYYQEPTLLKSAHCDLYFSTCRNLFETYVRFTVPIREHVRKQLPHEPKTSQAAYERSVRARGFDIIRGLLPAATLTNIGVFGNGRFFETLIMKLRTEPFVELNEIGRVAYEELAKVIPSFVRRAEAEHKHFQDFRNFSLVQQKLFRNFAAKHLDQFKITDTHIKNAITKIRSEGRLQCISQGKLRNYVSKNNQILVDGAHNTLAALAVEKYLKSLNSGKKIIMLLGMMANKEHKKFIQIFKNRVHSIIALNIPNQENFIEKVKLSKIAQSCGIPSKTENSIESALKNISKENNNAIIFCTGSLYFVGEILNLN